MPWSNRPASRCRGDGITLIMEGGRVFERAGCGFAMCVAPAAAVGHAAPLNWRVRRLSHGRSLVFTRATLRATVHMNVRMIAAGHPGTGTGLLVWWRHGPHAGYGFEEDACISASCRDAWRFDATSTRASRPGATNISS